MVGISLPSKCTFNAFTYHQHMQTCRMSSSAAALLGSEQGPCEPSKDFVSKFGEQQRARESLRKHEQARGSHTGAIASQRARQRESERARERELEREPKRA